MTLLDTFILLLVLAFCVLGARFLLDACEQSNASARQSRHEEK